MLKCPYCKFLSNPETGNIYDARFPCPKCGKKARPRKTIPGSRTLRCNPGLGRFGDTTKTAKVVSLVKTLGYGAGFYFAFTKLGNIDSAGNTRDRKLKQMLGPTLPALRQASFLIPALALPEITALVTGNERPLMGLAAQVAIVFGMVWVVSRPFTKALNGAS